MSDTYVCQNIPRVYVSMFKFYFVWLLIYYVNINILFILSVIINIVNNNKVNEVIVNSNEVNKVIVNNTN